LKLINDFKKFLANDKFQEDFVFLLYFTILLAIGIIPVKTFELLAGLIIGGDVMKRLGKWKG